MNTDELVKAAEAYRVACENAEECDREITKLVKQIKIADDELHKLRQVASALRAEKDCAGSRLERACLS